MKIKEFTPLNDRVLVKPLDQGERRKGGILIADMGEDRPKIGKVIAVGPGRTTEFGTFIEVHAKVGDIIVLPIGSTMRIEIQDQEYFVCPDKEIVAVVEIEEED